MKEALKEAMRAYDHDEVPVGAVIAFEGKLIARAHNQVELLKDPTAHAEMIAITQACGYLGRWRLTGCRLYVSLEPCSMCAGAMVLARLDAVFFGAKDPKAGACGSLRNIVLDDRLNHKVQLVSGLMENDSQDLLQEFFRKMRNKRKTDLIE
ncbi:nucleoside deaminase [PVC group bacterium]|nr:nucleoside deaminase [PVC group bacterium]